MATIEEGLQDLDRQEQENEERFKAAIHAYFESRASISGARKALIFARDNSPGEQVKQTGE